jgi:hypothetical protein
VPVNPGQSEILGERAFATLTAAAEERPIELVDIFRRSEHVGPIVDEAIALRPSPLLIWLQQGIIDFDAQARAQAAGVPFVMDRCLAVEHRHLEV